MARPKKVEKNVQVGITIPPDLKREMDEAPERGSVNWSAVAADAFRHKLTQLLAERNPETRMERRQRWKACDQEDASEMYNWGKKKGEEWADKIGRPKQFRKLEAAVKQEGGIFGGEDCAADVYRAIFGNGDNDDVSEFWEGVLRLDAEDARDEEFCRGFVAGVLELWEADGGDL